MYEHQLWFSVHEMLAGRTGLEIPPPDGGWYEKLERALEYDRAVKDAVNG